MNFNEKLLKASRKKKSLLCIGLDPDPEQMPEGVDVLTFNQAIIEATSDLVCAYKLNLAFYEALDIDGLMALRGTIAAVPADIPVIGDAKRGDIGNTARSYARSIFDIWKFDATTVNPYLGFDSIEPFLRYQDKGIFILCRTTNPGAMDFQSLSCLVNNEYHPLYELVGWKAAEWNKHGNIGLVAGATYPAELRLIRQAHMDMFLLIPGIGAQGGDLAAVVRNGVDDKGEKAIINVSRQVIFASKGADFAEAARHKAREIKDQINQYRASLE